jgi:hypothetical protein
MPNRGSRRAQRLEQEEVEIVRFLDREYTATVVRKYVYMCKHCRFVWPLLHLAELCGERGHPEEIEQTYYNPYRTDEGMTHVYRPVRYEP